MFTRTKTLVATIALGGLAACAQSPDAVGVEPIFDKFGDASCPAGYALSGEMCWPISKKRIVDGSDATTSSSDPDPEPDPDDGGSGNQNQNRNENNNQNQTETQNQSG